MEDIGYWSDAWLFGLPVVAAWVGVTYYHLGLYWCWSVLTIWILGLGVIYLTRFLGGYWREMRVIEHSSLPEDEEAKSRELEPCGTDA